MIHPLMKLSNRNNIGWGGVEAESMEILCSRASGNAFEVDADSVADWSMSRVPALDSYLEVIADHPQEIYCSMPFCKMRHYQETKLCLVSLI